MLVGKNIILRPLKIEDLKKTNEWRNNLKLVKLTLGIKFPKTLEMDREWFNNVLNDKSNRTIYFGIDEIESKEFIGIIQLRNIDYISGVAQWGFIIGDSKHRGKGYSIEAPDLMFSYAFNVLNLRKIYGHLINLNKATFRMHEKIGGFIQEGILSKHVYFDNEYHDVMILSIFKDVFNKVSSKREI